MQEKALCDFAVRVGDALAGEPPVGEVQRRRDGVADQLGATEGNGEGISGDESAEDRQEGERQEPAGSAGVEVA